MQCWCGAAGRSGAAGLDSSNMSSRFVAPFGAPIIPAHCALCFCTLPSNHAITTPTQVVACSTCASYSYVMSYTVPRSDECAANCMHHMKQSTQLACVCTPLCFWHHENLPAAMCYNLLACYNLLQRMMPLFVQQLELFLPVELHSFGTQMQCMLTCHQCVENILCIST